MVAARGPGDLAPAGAAGVAGAGRPALGCTFGGGGVGRAGGGAASRAPLVPSGGAAAGARPARAGGGLAGDGGYGPSQPGGGLALAASLRRQDRGRHPGLRPAARLAGADRLGPPGRDGPAGAGKLRDPAGPEDPHRLCGRGARHRGALAGDVRSDAASGGRRGADAAQDHAAVTRQGAGAGDDRPAPVLGDLLCRCAQGHARGLSAPPLARDPTQAEPTLRAKPRGT